MSLVYNNLVFPRCHTKKPHEYVLKTRGKTFLLQSDSYCPILNLKRGGKICRRLSTSSFKREIRKLHVVVHVKEKAKTCTQECDPGAKLFFLLTKSTGFFDVLVASLTPKSLCILVTGGGGGGASFCFTILLSPLSCFSLATGLCCLALVGSVFLYVNSSPGVSQGKRVTEDIV